MSGPAAPIDFTPITTANDALDVIDSQVYKGKQALTNFSSLATESTPLLEAIQTNPTDALLEVTRIDPKRLAEEQGKKLALRLTGPLLAYVPDVEQYAENADDNQTTLMKLFIEACLLAKYAGPVFFTLVQEHSVVVAPTVSLGQLSTAALAASTIASMVASVTGYSIIQGLTSALDDSLASTAGNPRLASVWCKRTGLITSLALLPILQVWLRAESILLALGQDAEVAQLASTFLKYTALGVPAYAFNEIMKRYLSSQGLSGATTRIMTLVAPMNILLNYILVDGPTPYRLGFVGAPISIALSYNLIAFFTISYLAVGVARAHITGTRPNAVPYPEGQTPTPPFFWSMWRLVCAGLAGVGRTAAQLWSKDLIGFAASMLGPRALASQAVLLATASTAYQAPRALSQASSLRVKKLMRKGDGVRAKIATVVALAAIVLVVLMLSNILLASAESWGELFNSDTAVIHDVATVAPFIALFQAFHGLSAWVDGTLDALGKSATFPALNASADYFSGIPLGLYLAFGRHWGLSGIWAGLTFSLAYSSLAATVVLIKSKWTTPPTVLVASENRDKVSANGVVGAAVVTQGTTSAGGR